jgi:hypothetical protein
MSQESMLTAVFRDRSDATEVFEWLREQGYATNEISVLMSDRTRQMYTEHEEGSISTGTRAAEGMATGGAIGTAVGATIGAIVAIGTSIAIPGLGLIVAGPIVAALAGGGAGAVAGGALGGLVGLGIPESNVHAYEQALREGGVVIGVRPRDSADSTRIRDYFNSHHADNVISA